MMRFAITAPIPLIAPEPRYLSMLSRSPGILISYSDTLNCML